MIRLAIPNKGRISLDIHKLLEKIGLDIPENGRKLYANTNNPNIQIVYARAADIPLYVEAGAADAGITGEDMIEESGALVKKLTKLNFGKCDIVIAAPKDGKIKSSSDFKGGIRVATKLVNISKKYFSKKNFFAQTIKISGATELAPYLGIADVVVDQVSTGTTLAANNLKVIDTISTSNMYLITNTKTVAQKEVEIEELKISIESVVTAEEKRYIMLNATSEEVLKKVVKVIPCLESPTILKLAKEGEYAVHSVVNSNELISTIRKLKEAGATGILVLNMSRVVE